MISSSVSRLFATLVALLLTFSSIHLYGQEDEKLVLITTSVGKVKVKLYNDTPLHRDNFLKHVESGQYEGLLFHRVIKQFMAQAGDINSKDASEGDKLGDGDLDYTIPAEIVFPKYFHKRGALCAARSSDKTNPKRESSATQFYIVTGKFFIDMELDKMEKENGRKFTPEQREAYMLEGGAPHLDDSYTVFGEVVKGQKIIDKLQLVETDENDRPRKDVRIESMEIVTK